MRNRQQECQGNKPDYQNQKEFQRKVNTADKFFSQFPQPVQSKYAADKKQPRRVAMIKSGPIHSWFVRHPPNHSAESTPRQIVREKKVDRNGRCETER